MTLLLKALGLERKECQCKHQVGMGEITCICGAKSYNQALTDLESRLASKEEVVEGISELLYSIKAGGSFEGTNGEIITLTLGDCYGKEERIKIAQSLYEKFGEILVKTKEKK